MSERRKKWTRDAYYMPTTWFWLRFIAIELLVIIGLLIWIGV